MTIEQADDHLMGDGSRDSARGNERNALVNPARKGSRQGSQGGVQLADDAQSSSTGPGTAGAAGAAGKAAVLRRGCLGI
jgi:hypothetical protein